MLLPRILRPAQRARTLLPRSPLIETLTLTLNPQPLRRTYSSDPHPSVFNSNLLRLLRSELTYLADYHPPLPPKPVFGSFWVEDRPGEQWVRLRSHHDGGREDVKVDATMVDGAVPVAKRPRIDDDAVRLHISLVVEVSKVDDSDNVLVFVCSAWPDYLEVQKVFPLLRHDTAPSRPYTGRDFKQLDRKMQDAVYEYLEERGVDDSLSEFLHQYMANKDKTELIRWLGTIGSHIQK